MSIIEKSDSKRATYQDVLDTPPHKVAEVIDGVLYTMPRPAVPHSIAGSALGWLIGGPFGHSRGRPGGWWIVNEPELHLGGDIVVPNIAGWRRERVPNYPNAAYWEVAPDWLCEVLSPSTRKIDLGPKSAIYARERVKHMWMVDPDARSLETFRLRSGHWRRLAKLTGNQEVSQPPFEAVSFPLLDLWGLPTPVVPHPRPRQVHDKEMGDE